MRRTRLSGPSLAALQATPDSGVACSAWAVLTPVYPPLPDPEVTPAFVRLADRGRNGRAPQPV